MSTTPQALPKPEQVWNDPEFQKLPTGEKIKVMQAIDPDFARLPVAEQFKVFKVTGFPESGAPPRAEEPGAIRRFAGNAWEASGIPGLFSLAGQTGKAIIKSDENPLGMPGALLKAGYGAVSGMASSQQEAIDRAYLAQKNAGFGGPMYGGIQGLNALIPVLGPQISKATEQVRSGDVAGGIGTTVGTVAPLGASALLKMRGAAGAEVEQAVKLFQKAAKPSAGKANFSKSVTNATPAIKQALSGLDEVPKDAAGVRDLLGNAKATVWGEYKGKISAASGAGTTADMIKVGDAIENSITKTTTLDSPKQASAIRKMADSWRQQGKLDIADAERLRKEGTAELDSFYGKFQRGQTVALTDAELAAKIAKVNALKQQIDGVIDKLPGEAGAELRRQYGGLNELDNALAKKMVKDGNATPSAMLAMGDAYAAFRLIKGAMTGNVAEVVGALAHKAVRAAITKRFSTDALLARAMQTLKSSSATGGLPAETILLLQALGQSPNGGATIEERMRARPPSMTGR